MLNVAYTERAKQKVEGKDVKKEEMDPSKVGYGLPHDEINMDLSEVRSPVIPRNFKNSMNFVFRFRVLLSTPSRSSHQRRPHRPLLSP